MMQAIDNARAPGAVGDIKVHCGDRCNNDERDLVTRGQHRSIVRADLLGD
jgi:hypothetical protein